MTNEQKIIDELREWIALCKASIFYDPINDPVFTLIELKIIELEQKYCKEEKKGCYACSECGHPHLLEDLIYFEGNGKVSDEL